MEELLEAEVVEEETEALAADDAQAAGVRPLPAPRSRGALEPFGGEVRTVAIAAAGGLVAGAATVVAVRAVRGASRASRSGRRRRPQRPVNVLASRSFLVDVHLLGK